MSVSLVSRRIRRREYGDSESSRVLGLDASLTSTGYAYRDSAGRIVTGRIMAADKVRGSRRLRQLRDQLAEVIRLSGATVVAIEDYAMSRGGSGRTFSIGEWGGLARVAALDHGCALYVYGVKVVKAYATGNGAAKKEPMIEAARSHGADTEQEDECDAVCVMLTCEAHTGRRKPAGVYASRAKKIICSEVIGAEK